MVFTVSAKTTLNIFLAIALAGLLALVVYEPGTTEAPAAEKLTTLMPETVQKISIVSTRHAPLLLEKKSGQWQMQAPLKMPANVGRIQLLLKVLQTKSIARYPMSRVDANQLQLDAPNLSLTFDNLLLRFGATDALGGSRYVQVGNTVHLITDRYSHLAKGKATDFVSSALLPPASVIDELVLPSLHLAQQGMHWLANEKPANADAIQSLLNEWRHARALRVSELAKTVMPLKATESITVTLGKEANKQTLHFSLLRNDSEIILQRQDLGIEYHFPVEAGERLLSLSKTDAESAQ